MQVMRKLLNATQILLAGLIGLVTLSPARCEETEEKLNVLVVTGFDVASHKWEESSRTIHAILEESGEFEVDISPDKEVFASDELGKYDAIVLCYGFWEEPEPGKEAKTGLLNYVRDGGGLVAMHFACSAFQDWDEYAVLLGRVWKKGIGGHGPYGEFTVNIKADDHPITRDMQDFTIQDELYAKLSGEEEIDVLASAYSDWSGKVEPIVFAKAYGQGRVVQNVLGHSMDSKQNPAYQKLLIRSVQWAANE